MSTLSRTDRELIYTAQTGRKELTPKQQKRIRLKENRDRRPN